MGEQMAQLTSVLLPSFAFQCGDSVVSKTVAGTQ